MFTDGTSPEILNNITVKVQCPVYGPNRNVPEMDITKYPYKACIRTWDISGLNRPPPPKGLIVYKAVSDSLKWDNC